MILVDNLEYIYSCVVFMMKIIETSIINLLQILDLNGPIKERVVILEC